MRPTATRESVTAQAAANFANIAVLLRRQYDERRVAHFINKLVFCLFAEDIDLLPDRIFAATLEEAIKRPDDFVPMLRELFYAMANRNGRFGMAAIPWFNGGLFDDDDVLPLGIVAVRDLMAAARLDWKAIDPTIFGTLFESGLDDKKRAEMASLFDAPDPEDRAQASLFKAPAANRGVGIHYTDEATIMKIIEPVVVAPLRRAWERMKAEIREIEEQRLEESRQKTKHWKRWGPYLSERAWGTVREDYSSYGTAWDYFPHDMARSRAYRWNEDGLAGICDRHQKICFALALWNGHDPILKERIFGLTGSEGNHGEDPGLQRSAADARLHDRLLRWVGFRR